MRRMVLALLLSSYLPSADASMVIDGTRIIFPGDKKEIAVRATNMGETPSLTQVWVDDGRVQINRKRMRRRLLCCRRLCASNREKPELAPGV
ncbi:putative pilin chaperone [Klebsiella pneumoniae]|uniref:Putative pilin chaperone n=1 Tax=Klebsiella pneumoniae TaxID=573 RepID=A0A4P0XXK3_KLEPN|nr:putative pilin chaperone [Klebsiella pneumoniae]